MTTVEQTPAATAVRMQPHDIVLRLFTPVALMFVVIAALLTVAGQSENLETGGWLLAFAAAVPGGLWLGARHQHLLESAAPAAPARAIAIGAALMATALVLGYSAVGGGGPLLATVFGLGAVLAPRFAASRWRDPGDRDVSIANAATAVVVVATALLFIPASTLRPGVLSGALIATAAVMLALRAADGRRLSALPRTLIDAALVVVLVAFVASFPPLEILGELVVHHGSFFLGPANDVMHGRPSLAGTWSQYGVGLITALAGFFEFNAIGFGHLVLLDVALTCAMYAGVYVTLRLAGVGQILTAAALLTAALGNIYGQWNYYAAFPSTSPLRFGFPYVIVLLAVLQARSPGRRWPWIAQLVVVAVAATWSFESWIYTAGAFGAVVLANALSGERPFRKVLHQGLQGIVASIAGVALFTIVTAVIADDSVRWGPYFDYLRLYSTEGFGQLPIDLYTPGLVMATSMVLSATAVVWLSASKSAALSTPVRVAIAGFTGFAIASFTYYLGRSHPNNLLHLLVPVVAIGFLWVHALVGGTPQPRTRWRWAAAAGLTLIAALVAAGSWPSVAPKWKVSGLGYLVSPGETGRLGGIRALWGNPTMDARSREGVELLKRYMPGERRSVVLTEPELTTEILLSADRANRLPMSHPVQDALLERSTGAVLAEARRLSPGSRILTSAPPADGSTSALGGNAVFLAPQTAALAELHRRFDFKVLATSPSGLQVVELTTKPAPEPKG